MQIETLKILFNRDLNKLKQEIELYQNENNLWEIEKGISNSAGNLCLHLIGNLKSFIGSELGKTNYVRNRPLEFSLKHIPKTELIEKIEATILVLNKTLDTVTPKILKQEYPILVFESKSTTEFFLVHLSTHLAYHL